MIHRERLLQLIRGDKALVEVRAFNTSMPIEHNTVIYLEDEFHEQANAYISSHYEELKKRFALRRMDFVYLPATTLTPEQMAYWDPSRQFTTPLPLRASMLYDVLQAKTLLGSTPAIVLCYSDADNYQDLCGLRVNDNNPNASFCHFFDLCDRSEEGYKPERSSLWESITGLICPSTTPFEKEKKNVCRDAPMPESCESDSCKPEYEDIEEDVLCCIGTTYDYQEELPTASSHPNHASFKAEYDECIPPEPQLTPDEEQLIFDIQRKLDLLRSHGLPESVLEKIFAPAVKPSRMLILKNGTILLPDFPNTVIDMIPLDKVLYLLLLRHPEGIYQKDLSDHIDEMKELYCRINNGFLPSRALAGILNLASPLSNSCNEKISRIRNVFQSHFQPAIASFYTISGGRAEARRIPLSPELIEWE